MKVAIVEDDPRYRASLSAVLRHAAGITGVDAFGDPRDAVAAAQAGARWDIVLMDIELPGISGVEATRQLKRTAPEIVVIMLTVFEDPSVVLQAICAGADGYLLKRSSADEIVDELRHVAAGGAPLTPRVAKSMLSVLRTLAPGTGMAGPAEGAPDLSQREEQVLRGLVDGRSYKQVAADLDISIDTVRGHIRRLYRKLQVHSVAEAVSRAIRERLV